MEEKETIIIENENGESFETELVTYLKIKKMSTLFIPIMK